MQEVETITNNRVSEVCHETELLALKAECHDLIEMAEAYHRGLQQAVAAVQAKRAEIQKLKALLGTIPPAS